MRTTTRCHLIAVQELVELISIGGLVAIIGDLFWVGHDIFVSEISRPGLWCILGILLIAFTITSIGVVNYHKQNVKRLLNEKLKWKLKLQKQLYKHRQN